MNEYEAILVVALGFPARVSRGKQTVIAEG